MGSLKMPDTHGLRLLLAAGMDRREIAARFDVELESVARRLSEAGLLDTERDIAHAKGVELVSAPNFDVGVRLTDDRVIFTSRVSAGVNGGTTLSRLSLPLVSLHVRHLRETGRVA